MSLFDHERRLHDLEVALRALADALGPEPDRQTRLRELGERLRSRGEGGAADLLVGEPAAAAYRR